MMNQENLSVHDPRELLTLAARAAGYVQYDSWSNCIRDYDSPHLHLPALYESGQSGESNSWNPLIDDGDAQRLSVELCMSVVHTKECHYVTVLGHSFTIDEPIGSNSNISARRAIVRAAAQVELDKLREKVLKALEIQQIVEWQIVPKVPTQAMIDEAFGLFEMPTPSGYKNGNDARVAIYNAMLSVAPVPEPMDTFDSIPKVINPNGPQQQQNGLVTSCECGRESCEWPRCTPADRRWLSEQTRQHGNGN